MEYPVTSGTGLEREVRLTLKSLDDLLPDIVFLLPKCDEEVTIRKTLADVAQQFCRDTGVFEYTTANVTVVDGTDRYAILIPFPADVMTVKEVRLYNVDPLTSAETFSRTLIPESFDVEDPVEEDRVYLKLWETITPSSAGSLVMKIDVSLIPRIDDMLGTQATALPEKFLRRWGQSFVKGTIAKLAGMDNRAWTNKSLAGENSVDFMSLRSEAFSKAQGSKMKLGGQSCRSRYQWP
jgi:hypothetical protein